MILPPLEAVHRRLGARFVEFGGWQMPLQYSSVLAEHRAVRSDAGWFDVSHLGRFELTGSGAQGALLGLLCNRIERIDPGRAQYTMLLNEGGGVVDDLIVWWWEPGRFWVMPNAAGHERVMAEFAGREGCSVRDLRPETVMLAVQGPRAPEVLASVLGTAPRRFGVTSVSWEGEQVEMAGTGYTGEAGGELCLPAGTATALVDTLIDAGVTACGLGARDTLRLEAGLPLWGQDIDESTTPFEAGLDFVVDFEHVFTGKEALEHQRSAGLGRRLAGIVLSERGVPRHGMEVRSGTGSGVVTSGNHSPVLERGIALAYLSPPASVGEAVEVDIRGRWTPGEVVDLPFHRLEMPVLPGA